ncbi:DUF4245 domain-containing protein [Nocardioides sp. Kera G14]|uniref:DUF4245 domain-containing protein n=1 Tax=Nocardioides sp. Kera G14 TaxID=2884264 RepID=UPI001D0F9228|nr:DUF4245 domain-containing protein [Nocardioides sp. Kera G14]UDY22902.1 DUF4245 domain-containing protein [Nocardioides sp. Kera G14]
MTQTAPSPSAGQPTEPTQGARRYPRTFGGLIGSMVVAVIAIVAYWGIQNLTHDHPEVKLDAVAYTETVGTVQEAGYTVAYPSSLPTGWKATSVHFTPGDHPTWGLGILTKSGTYAGVAQADVDLSSLLTTYVDKAARQGADATIRSQIGSTWSTWSDSGGDHAFATTIDVKGAKQAVLVYGSAPVADLRDLAASLTTAPTK